MMSMSQRCKTAAATVAVVGALIGATACTPTSTYNGFQVVDQSPAAVKVGEPRATVLARLGTPTAKSLFGADTWYYMSQLSSHTAFYHPRVNRRDITAIAFAKGSDEVTAVNTYSLKDGRVIAFNGRETPTRGREMTVLEQLLGSISAGGVLPPDENQTPGSHGDTSRGP
jgi:outer membrane protein assembly factor BamE (lipoprotein component of BamABCDE complex)